MADETVIVQTAPSVTDVTTATPPAEATKTDKPADVMIPKSRFDEVNNKLRELEKQMGTAQKEREAADRKAAEEQGKYKELYEKAQEAADKAKQEAQSERLRLLKRDAAAKVGLPARLADRLQGETAEELEADAKIVLGDLPKPGAPNINATGGGNPPPITPEAIVEQKRLSGQYVPY